MRVFDGSVISVKESQWMLNGNRGRKCIAQGITPFLHSNAHNRDEQETDFQFPLFTVHSIFQSDIEQWRSEAQRRSAEGRCNAAIALLSVQPRGNSDGGLN